MKRATAIPDTVGQPRRARANGTPGEPEAHVGYASSRRLFRIIDRVARDGEQLTVKVLAQDLEISLSTCYQLVSILVVEGYVEKLPHHAGYRLGPAISVLAEHARRSSVGSVIDPILEQLARRCARNTYFGVLAGGEVLVEQVHAPPDSPPVGVAPGFRGAAHALALGKVLIAAGGVQSINDYIDAHRLEAFTRRTITDPALLEAHLKEVRMRGFATDFEEFAKNLCCVAVPIAAPGGVPGAIGLSTTASSTTQEIKLLIELARRAADRIATALQ